MDETGRQLLGTALTAGALAERFAAVCRQQALRSPVVTPDDLAEAVLAATASHR